jgi:hypothetical protein
MVMVMLRMMKRKMRVRITNQKVLLLVNLRIFCVCVSILKISLSLRLFFLYSLNQKALLTFIFSSPTPQHASQTDVLITSGLTEESKAIVMKQSETKMLYVLQNLQSLYWERFDVLFRVCE